MHANSYIKAEDHITVVFDNGETSTVYASQPNFQTVVEAIKVSDWDAAYEATRPAVAFAKKYEDGRVSVDAGVVTLDGSEMHGTLVDRMVDMHQEGFDVEPLARFLANLNQNPDFRAVNELYGFLEASSLSITKDGHFVAYKMVSDDYKDTYTGKMDNSVGMTVSMARNKVNNDKERTCSEGLHFCGRGYLGQYPGNRTLVLKIDPADVVSIPVDYNNHKGRCCKYTVIGELTSGNEEILEGGLYQGEGLDDQFDADFGFSDENEPDVLVDDDPFDWVDEGEVSPDVDVRYFPSRDRARLSAQSPGRKFLDNGASAPKGRRWASVKTTVTSEADDRLAQGYASQRSAW